MTGVAGSTPGARGPGFAAVIFDLDGTLVDSRPGIEESCRVALAEVAPGIHVPDISGVLGKPLEELVAAIGPTLTEEQRSAVRAAFARVYDGGGWRCSELYPGVGDALRALRAHAVRLFVATNKRRLPSERILAAVGLRSCFEAVYALDSADGTYADKPAMAKACLADHALEPTSTLVVGDSGEDYAMARVHGLSFAAARWGYGAAAACLRRDAASPGHANGAEHRPLHLVLLSMGDLVPLVMAATPGGGS